ncbi:MAG: type II secretion system F family protein [Desulfacinum sp.]|jgi:type IV pilus assembly protein PilC|nr:type II secretion system F family protein [Desulfacinum sp.]
MPAFKYLALDLKGRPRRGTVDAVDEWDAEKRLERMGLSVVRLTPVPVSRLARMIPRRVSLFDLAHLYDRLSDSLQVGLPLPAVLEEIARQVKNPRIREALEDLRLQVEEGRTLSQGMERHARIFDRLQVGIVRMGEVSGTLPGALRRLADFLSWQAEQKAQVRRALIYPLSIMAAVAVVTGIWVGYVLPQVSGLLVNMDIVLPAPTRVILAVSAFLQRWWPALTAALILSGAGFLLWSRTESGRLTLDKWLLHLPFLGPVLLHVAMCRLCVHFSMMLEAGMTVGTIFEILTGGALGNRYLEKDVARIHQEVLAGRTLYQAFSTSRIYPDLVLGGLRTGEMTGTLSETFRKLGAYYDKDVTRQMKALTAAFEPASLLLLGGVFGAIILAILLPLYDVFSKVRGF